MNFNYKNFNERVKFQMNYEPKSILHTKGERYVSSVRNFMGKAKLKTWVSSVKISKALSNFIKTCKKSNNSQSNLKNKSKTGR